MNQGSTIFSQIMGFLPKHKFRQCVSRYKGNYRVRSFTCFDQFLCMAFAQLTYRESLRDIVCCLRTMREKLYHMGFRGKVSRTTLARANENRDWRIYADFAQVLIHKARQLYVDDDLGLQLKHAAYALDATTIDLCLSLFPWAKFRKHKAAVKLHTLMDLKGSIPCYIHIADGKVHDVNVLDHLVLEPGAYYVMDRGYLDFHRLFKFTQNLSTFVTRAKSNFDYRRLQYRSVDKSTGLRCDQTIRLNGYYAAKDYPAVLRRISYLDATTQKRLVFLTNNFTLDALTIARLYQSRWRIELFFKWIKQNLKIKRFLGRSDNAVRIQLLTALIAYLLIDMYRRRQGITTSLHLLVAELSVTLFQRPQIEAYVSHRYHRRRLEFEDLQRALPI